MRERSNCRDEAVGNVSDLLTQLFGTPATVVGLTPATGDERKRDENDVIRNERRYEGKRTEKGEQLNQNLIKKNVEKKNGPKKIGHVNNAYCLKRKRT